MLDIMTRMLYTGGYGLRRGLDLKNPFNWYSPWFYVLVVVSVAIVVAGAFVGHSLALRSTARTAVAVIQGLSASSVIISVFVSLRRLDELEQRIQYESLAIAFAATAIVLTIYGFLERAGLPTVQWALWVYPLMFAFWAVSSSWYNATDEESFEGTARQARLVAA